MKNLPKIIVALGPTASGKTDLGIALAKKYNGEIVSADSRTVYRGMDIGTAKPVCDATLDSRLSARGGQRRGNDNRYVCVVKGVPHYMIDVVEPEAEFSLADYKKVAIEKITDILKRGKLPIIVGGTGLYVWAIVDNLEIPAVAPDNALRAELEKKSLDELVADLKKIDPATAEKIDLKNPRRVLRALEVCLGSGESFFEQRKKAEPLYDAMQIGLKWPREELNERIDKRVEMMIEDGLVEEVKGLYERLDSRLRGNDNIGIPTLNLPLERGGDRVWALPSMSGIGYKQVGYYLKGEMTLDEAVELIKKDTRHYAKRQMTWFRRDKRIRWVERDDIRNAEALVEEFLD